ncbi:hypothetical protein [Paenibacillus sp. NPDC057967]|uniref:hypothetical protein n=1 Tax=Paenibacillus sp. NPDC057967 TaxID=3346293 RepID=UPI0036DDDE4B
MSITTTGHNKLKDYLQGLIKEGRYYIGSTPTTVPIFKTERSGDVITFYLYLDDTVTGTINKFQLIDQAGAVFDDQPDSVAKPNINGLLVAFKYTLRRV